MTEDSFSKLFGIYNVTKNNITEKSHIHEKSNLQLRLTLTQRLEDSKNECLIV